MPSKLKISTFLRVYYKSLEARLGPADPREPAKIPCATIKPGQSKRSAMRSKPTEFGTLSGLEDTSSATPHKLSVGCDRAPYCIKCLNQYLAPEGRQFQNSLISPVMLDRRDADLHDVTQVFAVPIHRARALT